MAGKQKGYLDLSYLDQEAYDQLRVLCTMYKALGEDISALTARRDEIKEDIINALFFDGAGNAAVGELEVTYQPRGLPPKIDTSTLKAVYPEVWEAVAEEGRSAMVVNVRLLKGEEQRD